MVGVDDLCKVISMLKKLIWGIPILQCATINTSMRKCHSTDSSTWNHSLTIPSIFNIAPLQRKKIIKFTPFFFFWVQCLPLSLIITIVSILFVSWINSMFHHHHPLNLMTVCKRVPFINVNALVIVRDYAQSVLL